VAHLKRRLATLEAQMAPHARHQVTWAEMHAAVQRQQARVRLKVCRRLGVEAMDPRVMRVEAQLVPDSPEQRAQDEETLDRWRQQQGRPPDHGEIRERIVQRLETMARRLGAERSR
jgi:hypothetical protein